MSLLNPIIKKLQYKLQEDVLIVDAPSEFKEILSDWKKTARIHTEPAGTKTFSFRIDFCENGIRCKKSSIKLYQTAGA